MSTSRFFLNVLSLLLGLGIASYAFPPAGARAQTPTFSQVIELAAPATATVSAATESAKTASTAAEAKIQQKKDQDLTETLGKQKSKLEAYLDSHPLTTLTWHNPLQHAIRSAIERGLPANIVVLLMLFPLIASVIAISRHVIGLSGFGIYIPAVLSVAFVSTGLAAGITLFALVFFAAVVTRSAIKRLKLPYLPRTAMLLSGVSLLLLLALVGSAWIDAFSLFSLNIFPLLIIVLLTENFMESQLFTSQKETLQLTMETLITAVICSLIIGSEPLQQFVLLRPELTFILISTTNFLIGRYNGLRLLEYLRFRAILDQS